MNIHEEEFEDQGPEPNMKLSHAFLVVLLLHVIAVGGLFAFNRMKADRKSSSKAQVAASSNLEAEKKGGNQGKNAPEDPNEGAKAPAVAKVPEPTRTKVSETGAKSASEVSSGGAKGLLSGAHGVLKKMATGGIVATASKSSAQTNGSDPAPQTELPATEGEKYTVHAGDTLTRIAATLGVSIPELEKANNMTGISTLQVGQVIKVPARATHAAETPAGTVEKTVMDESKGMASTVVPAADPSTSQAPVAGEYTVVKGDNPYKIAKKFKVTPDELMKANGISDPKKIQIGQKLAIPASTKKAGK